MSRAVRTGAAAALALLGMALAPAGSTARAQPARTGPPDAADAARVAVSVVAPRCPTAPFDVASFLAILRAELRPLPYDLTLATTEEGDDENGGRAVLRLETVPCDPATASVEATYEDRRTDLRLRKRVDLTDVAPDGRARVLALVLAEWLREEPGRDRQARSAPAPSASASSTPPPAPAPAVTAPPLRENDGAPASDAPPRRLGLHAAAEARVYSSFVTPLAGGRIGARLRARALPLRVALDAGFLAGTTHLELGAVNVRAAAASAGLDLVTGGRRVALALGPRVELGWGWIAGRPGDASVRAGRVDGLLVGASLAGALDVRPTSAFELFLEVEGGLTFAEVVGLSDGARAAGFTGPWAAGRLGARIGLW